MTHGPSIGLRHRPVCVSHPFAPPLSIFTVFPLRRRGGEERGTPHSTSYGKAFSEYALLSRQKENFSDVVAAAVANIDSARRQAGGRKGEADGERRTAGGGRGARRGEREPLFYSFIRPLTNLCNSATETLFPLCLLLTLPSSHRGCFSSSCLSFCSVLFFFSCTPSCLPISC